MPDPGAPTARTESRDVGDGDDDGDDGDDDAMIMNTMFMYFQENVEVNSSGERRFIVKAHDDGDGVDDDDTVDDDSDDDNDDDDDDGNDDVTFRTQPLQERD